MEASLGAARMMAVNPVDQRPSWADASHEIDAEQNLVANGKILVPAKLHYPLKAEGETEATPVAMTAHSSEAVAR